MPSSGASDDNHGLDRPPTSSKVLCTVYGVISTRPHRDVEPEHFLFRRSGRLSARLLERRKVTPATSRSLTVDILLFFLAAAILMVIEARKHEVRFVWAYIAGGFAIAISVTFPFS